LTGLFDCRTKLVNLPHVYNTQGNHQGGHLGGILLLRRSCHCYWHGRITTKKFGCCVLCCVVLLCFIPVCLRHASVMIIGFCSIFCCHSATLWVW